MIDSYEVDNWGRYIEDDHSDMYRQSRCSKGLYCDFEPLEANEYQEQEICKKCGRKVRYRKIDGRIDSQRYLMEHMPLFAQKQGKTAKLYEQIHGKPKYRKIAGKIV